MILLRGTTENSVFCLMSSIRGHTDFLCLCEEKSHLSVKLGILSVKMEANSGDN